MGWRAETPINRSQQDRSIQRLCGVDVVVLAWGGGAGGGVVEEVVV